VIARVPDGIRVGITGLGAHVPQRVLSNDDLARTIGTSDEWIRTRTGISERRIAAEGEAASDLAVPAALAALERADADPATVELVLVATASPDMLFPSTASILAARIGADRAAAYDLSAGCTGFVYGLAQAHAAVAAGLARRALVVGSEVLSRLTDWHDRSTCILFADGAGAAVVEAVDDGGFLGFELGNDGSRWEEITLAAGGSRRPATHETVAAGEHLIRMNGQAVFRFSTRVIPESVTRLLDACGLTLDDVDVYAPHQANKRIIDHAARRLGLAAGKVLSNIDRYGNTSTASIPLVLDDAVRAGRIVRGRTVLMSAVGAGLTWGSAALVWSGERRRP
jgi:3-oxoacyl-[acyl-carrier-protein] synthase III